MSSVCIVIKSYPKDYPWLAYCLRSIQKYCSGFSEVIVMMPRGEMLPLTAETVVPMDVPESYLSQQVCKLNADLHTQSDFILHVDSDTIFTAPVTPDFFFRGGKPVWLYTPWEGLCVSDKKAWFHVMAKCLQEASPAEFMRKCAVIVPRQVYAKFREFIQRTHGMSMEQYVMSQPGHEFSEYNCIGFFAWLFHRELFHWHNTEEDGVPQWPFRQFWSWGGLTPAVQFEIEGYLR